MLTEEDKNYVIEKLIFWIGPLDRPRETLTAPFFGTTFPGELRQGNPNELVIDAVRLCLIDAWNNTPPWIVRLIDLVPGGIDEKLASIRKIALVKPPPAPSPFDSTILDYDIPFVNRSTLRKNLRRLATPAAATRPIFVVNGLEKSGKSYSTTYIDHFSYKQPPITPNRIEFEPDFGLELGAEDVASELVSKMGRSLGDKPPHTTNQKLYARQLALWVLREAALTPTNHWFILDNFRGEKLRPDTRDFLVALSNEITTGVFPQRFRLILIGFDRAMLVVDPGKVEEEQIGPCLLSDVDVCIEEILKRAPTPVPLAAISPLVVNGLPNGDQRMQALNMRLRALLLAVQEVRDILTPIQGADFEQVLCAMLAGLPTDKEYLPELEKRLRDLRASA
jgi:hypothetical protein